MRTRTVAVGPRAAQRRAFAMAFATRSRRDSANLLVEQIEFANVILINKRDRF